MSKPFPLPPRYDGRLGLRDGPGVPAFESDPPEDICGGCLRCIACLDPRTGRQVCTDLACAGADPGFCQVCWRWRYDEYDMLLVQEDGGWQPTWRPIWECPNDEALRSMPAYVPRLCWASSTWECYRFMRLFKRLT